MTPTCSTWQWAVCCVLLEEEEAIRVIDHITITVTTGVVIEIATMATVDIATTSMVDHLETIPMGIAVDATVDPLVVTPLEVETVLPQAT